MSRAKGLSYTQRTLRALREKGLVVGMVERYNAFVGKFGIREDLFGFIDIIALDPVRGIVAVQSTSGGCFVGHRKKILEECTDNAIEWLKCGGKIELWGWRKLLVKRGGKAMRWMPRVEEITLKDFNVR